ncbi:hypothetical protein ACM55F_10065 [Flavobacterium sp. XS2P12]|uniref:hypothetical protein n=1 Tax=Flavobacterium melibiosi TaxID=3398734 RepID=UPI003A8B4752
MKTFYTEISIDYLDISIDEDEPNAEPYQGRYVDSFIVIAKTDVNALEKVFYQAHKGFIENHNREENILKSFHIDVFYETSEDARAS